MRYVQNSDRERGKFFSTVLDRLIGQQSPPYLAMAYAMTGMRDPWLKFFRGRIHRERCEPRQDRYGADATRNPDLPALAELRGTA